MPALVRQPVKAPQQDPTSKAWLCNVSLLCTTPAVIQWAAPDPTGATPDTKPAYACATHQVVPV
jgi:hypothetical protein